MSPLGLAQGTLLSPVVLAFALGLLAALVRSDLVIPEGLVAGLSLYLMLAIGMKGGVQLRDADLGSLLAPAVATVLIGIVTPIVVVLVARSALGLDVANAASLAAHYGSVSAVTFTAAMTLLEVQGVEVEGFMTTLLALLEVPAIVVALVIAAAASPGTRYGAAIRATFAGKSVLLLLGGLLIGLLSEPDQLERVKPIFVEAFYGALVLFLLGLGLAVGRHIADLRSVGSRLVVFGLAAPLVQGTVGVVLGTATGLSVGGAAVLGVMAASASYIAAPAAVRSALPAASPAVSLVPALGVTFPLNLTIGIPLFYALAQAVG